MNLVNLYVDKLYTAQQENQGIERSKFRENMAHGAAIAKITSIALGAIGVLAIVFGAPFTGALTIASSFLFYIVARDVLNVACKSFDARGEKDRFAETVLAHTIVLKHLASSFKKDSREDSSEGEDLRGLRAQEQSSEGPQGHPSEYSGMES